MYCGYVLRLGICPLVALADLFFLSIYFLLFILQNTCDKKMN